MYVKLTIPERLKDLRIERGLTLEQLAEATELSKSALGSYEADDYKDISPYSIVTLAKFYGVSTDYLLGVSEIKNHPDTDLAGLHLSDEMLGYWSNFAKTGDPNGEGLETWEAYDENKQFLWLKGSGCLMK